MQKGSGRVWFIRRIALLGMLLAAALWLYGCGGGSGSDSYDDPDADFYAKDAAAVTLVEPVAVKAWVDAGMKTESGQRVVILDCVPNPPGVFAYSDTDSWFAGDKSKVLANLAQQYGVLSPQYKSFNGMGDGMFGHIPGAIPNVSHEGYEVTKRNEGPILADHEVGTGDLIDQMLRKLGITKNDVLVLTTSRYDYPGFCSSRLWWTLRYWGFPRNQIVVLNGSNKAYAMAGYPLQKGVTLPPITPSSISVTDLPKKFFNERISLGELIGLVDSGRTVLPDSDPNKVVVIDTRQPPVAYYFKDANVDQVPDIYQMTGYVYDPTAKLFLKDGETTARTLSEVLFGAGYLAIPFDAVNNPPIDLTKTPASTYLAMHPLNGAPLAIPLGAKEAAFEGIVRGAKLTKTPVYNITVPALTRADGGYKTKAELLNVFKAASIDGSKPIVTYCNSGALASIYYYALKELCGFQNVRMYDGSWQEWANLAAYEPVTLDYVVNDDYATFPKYPAASPSIVFFSGKNNYFTYDPVTDQFKDSQAATVVGNDMIKSGGTLAGNSRWDVITRSEFVIFRPKATLQSAPVTLNGKDYRNKSYSSAVDWPSVQTTPNYEGAANKIREEDEAYQGASGASGGSAPTPFVPKGGGC
jgi:3-mercaptopyruvate sulfurtransferase SseA